MNFKCNFISNSLQIYICISKFCSISIVIEICNISFGFHFVQFKCFSLFRISFFQGSMHLNCNETRICTSKDILRAWRVGESKRTYKLQCPSNFRNYSISQMPSDGKLIASQFRFRIRAGFVLTKYFLHVLSVRY